MCAAPPPPAWPGTKSCTGTCTRGAFNGAQHLPSERRVGAINGGWKKARAEVRRARARQRRADRSAGPTALGRHGHVDQTRLAGRRGHDAQHAHDATDLGPLEGQAQRARSRPRAAGAKRCASCTCQTSRWPSWRSDADRTCRGRAGRAAAACDASANTTAAAIRTRIRNDAPAYAGAVEMIRRSCVPIPIVRPSAAATSTLKRSFRPSTI